MRRRPHKRNVARPFRDCERKRKAKPLRQVVGVDQNNNEDARTRGHLRFSHTLTHLVVAALSVVYKSLSHDILQNNKSWSPEKAEQEGLFMIESFLMGVLISDVRDRYSDEIIQQPELNNEEESEQAENVLSFRPK